MIGDVQIVVRAKVKIARRREDPRMVKDLTNGDSLANRWDEQTIYQVSALDRCLAHGLFLDRRQASVDLNHQLPSTFLRRCPLARTQKWKLTDDHTVQNDSSVYQYIVALNNLNIETLKIYKLFDKNLSHCKKIKCSTKKKENIRLLTGSTNPLPARIVYLQRIARELRTPEIRTAFAEDRCWCRRC